MADLFTRLSGNVENVRAYVTYEKKQRELLGAHVDQATLMRGCPVSPWTYLEDLALKKPEDSPEFQVLKLKKGIQEIQARRHFLGATPTYSTTYMR
jgi:hypothetical protein